jgi:hypothetical protein
MALAETLFTFAHVTDAHLYDITDSPVYARRSLYGPTLDEVTPLIESLNSERELDRARDRWVLFFSHVPVLWPRRPPTHDRFPAQSASFNFSGSHGPLRDLFARHGRVLAQYSGHRHVHGHERSGGTHVITTAVLCNHPGEYRLVTVKRDRIEHRRVAIPALARQPICWTGCADDVHPSASLFHQGLPPERDMVIPYG